MLTANRLTPLSETYGCCQQTERPVQKGETWQKSGSNVAFWAPIPCGFGCLCTSVSLPSRLAWWRQAAPLSCSRLPAAAPAPAGWWHGATVTPARGFPKQPRIPILEGKVEARRGESQHGFRPLKKFRKFLAYSSFLCHTNADRTTK